MRTTRGISRPAENRCPSSQKSFDLGLELLAFVALLDGDF
jgi:hypothetical protein